MKIIFLLDSSSRAVTAQVVDNDVTIEVAERQWRAQRPNSRCKEEVIAISALEYPNSEMSETEWLKVCAEAFALGELYGMRRQARKQAREKFIEGLAPITR